MDMKPALFNSKQAMTKILEVMIAIIFTFTFLAILIPQAREMTEGQTQPSVSPDDLLRDESFRDCLVQENVSCITRRIEWIVPQQYEYRYQFFAETPKEVQLPDDTAIDAVSSFMIVANASAPYGFTPYTFVLYYWQ